MYAYPRMMVINMNGNMKIKPLALILLHKIDACSHAAMKDQ